MYPPSLAYPGLGFGAIHKAAYMPISCQLAAATRHSSLYAPSMIRRSDAIHTGCRRNRENARFSRR